MALPEKDIPLELESMPASASSPGAGAKSFSVDFEALSRGLSTALEVQTIHVPPPPSGGGATNGQIRKRLKATEKDKQYLPGQPRIRLDGPDPHNTDGDQVLAYLRENLLTDELDGLMKFMKYIFVQTPSFRHIMPLHHQKAHAREIMVNEHPGLHLLWYYERIFVKPIPAYFYSPAFWDYLRDADPHVRMAAVGFMRSWTFLVRYELDFDLACSLKLIPKKPDGQLPTYEEFSAFLAEFTVVGDTAVNRRYHYGELRLTRINSTALLFRRKLAYFHIYPQWGSYLSHILAPIITVFAVCSVVLESMQVTLNAQQLTPGIPSSWAAFVEVALYFPVAVMAMIAFFLSAGGVMFFVMGVKDMIWGKSVRHRKKKGDTHAGEKSHGMIW